MVMRRYVVGLDLGRAAEFTALAVVERADDDQARDADPMFAVKYLRRFPPGTAYKAIVAGAGELLTTGGLANARVVVDVTAVGMGVLDLFRGLDPRPYVEWVVVTAGHHVEYGPHGTCLVPKKELVTCLQLLLQGRRLAIPTAMPDADLLARELGNFRAKASLTANPLDPEWREGQDDDLVLAVAMACWKAAEMSRPFVDREPPVAKSHDYEHYFRAVFPNQSTRPPWDRDSGEFH
jgi:hypothetical protein